VWRSFKRVQTVFEAYENQLVQAKENESHRNHQDTKGSSTISDHLHQMWCLPIKCCIQCHLFVGFWRNLVTMGAFFTVAQLSLLSGAPQGHHYINLVALCCSWPSLQNVFCHTKKVMFVPSATTIECAWCIQNFLRTSWVLPRIPLLTTFSSAHPPRSAGDSVTSMHRKVRSKAQLRTQRKGQTSSALAIDLSGVHKKCPPSPLSKPFSNGYVSSGVAQGHQHL
jgi:hypothetical protein